MTRFGFMLAALGMVLAAGTALGQTKEIQDPLNARLEKQRAARRMDEHIEVFRRLLDRELTKGRVFHEGLGSGAAAWQVHNIGLGNSLAPMGQPQPLALTHLQYAPAAVDVGYAQPRHLADAGVGKLTWKVDGAHGSIAVPLAEGVYLKGRGVVFTGTLPFEPRNPLGAMEKRAEKPLTDWERELRGLRGEKTDTGKKPEAPPSVSETVLRLLADNGKHFTELAPDEQVTVAVVFRPATVQQCSACHQSLAKGELTDPSALREALPAMGTSLKKPSDSVVAFFKNDMTLADFHLKQGHPQSAASIYRKLIDQCNELLGSWEKLSGDAAAADRLYIVMVGMEVHAKLAQALIALGDVKAAEVTLKKGEAFARKIEQVTAPQKTVETPPAIPVPAKLVISASKKILDQAGSGKMSLDDFRKAATIEYTGAEKE